MNLTLNTQREYKDRLFKAIFGRDIEESKKWRLDLYNELNDTSGAYEWTAYVKNININHNKTLQQKCKSLYDYSRFVAKIRENTKAGMEGKEAVNDAVNMAISENLLDGFFERQRSEVIGMILTEFDEEVFKQNVREDGYLEGLEDGASQKAMETAENFLKEGISTERREFLRNPHSLPRASCAKIVCLHRSSKLGLFSHSIFAERRGFEPRKPF